MRAKIKIIITRVFQSTKTGKFFYDGVDLDNGGQVKFSSVYALSPIVPQMIDGEFKFNTGKDNSIYITLEKINLTPIEEVN